MSKTVTLPQMAGAVHRTDIEWADYAVGGPVRFWNPEAQRAHNGCIKHGRGCLNCYAEAITVRFGGLPYTAASMKKLTPYLDEGALRHMLTFRPKGPFKNGRDRAAVFLGDMTDLLGAWVPDEWIRTIADHCAKRPDVDWLWLTKRPERYSVVRDWPLNCWTGVSFATQKEADANIPALVRASGAAVRFVSAEPLEERVTLPGWLKPVYQNQDGQKWRGYEVPWAKYRVHGRGPLVDLLICGGESGSKARPFDLAWARSLRDQCAEIGTAFYLKQVGSVPVIWCGQCGKHIGRVPGGMVGACGPTHAVMIAEAQRIHDPKGGKPEQWPEDLRGCRAFPEVRP